MGTIEHASRKRRKKESIQRAVLSVAALAGGIAVAAVAPNIFQIVPSFMGRKYSKLTYQTRSAANRLANKGFVRFISKNGKKHMEITEKGLQLLAVEQARSLAPARTKKRWDGRYRLVMFDIPQHRRNTRDKLRFIMRDFGFLRLQDSVWISPYDCEDLIALVKAELRIGKDVLYAVVDQIEHDGSIKKHFGLSS